MAQTTYKDITGKNIRVGAPEQIAIGGLQAEYDSNRAIREYQRKQAQTSLQNALGSINRDALQAYQNVSNDYAARGMQRSGGYAAADDRAYGMVQDAKQAQQTQYDTLAGQTNLQDLGDKQQLSAGIFEILQQLIDQRANAKINQTGAR